MPLNSGGQGPSVGGSSSYTAITSATVVKASAGEIVTVNVIVAGSATGAVYDFAATTGYTTANEVAVIPTAVSSYPMYSFPCFTGILIVPGTGQTVSVAFS